MVWVASNAAAVAIASYAAAVATLALVWQIHAWRRGRRNTLKVRLRSAWDATTQTPILVIEVQNLTPDRSVRVTAVGYWIEFAKPRALTTPATRQHELEIPFAGKSYSEVEIPVSAANRFVKTLQREGHVALDDGVQRKLGCRWIQPYPGGALPGVVSPLEASGFCIRWEWLSLGAARPLRREDRIRAYLHTSLDGNPIRSRRFKVGKLLRPRRRKSGSSYMAQWPIPPGGQIPPDDDRPRVEGHFYPYGWRGLRTKVKQSPATDDEGHRCSDT